MLTLAEVYRRWPDHAACVKHLETVRWGESPACTYCASEKVSRHRETGRWSRWQCQDCGKSFSVTVGTVFHNTRVGLWRWFLLIHMVLNAEDLSTRQAARAIRVRQPTVWSMMRRLSKAKTDNDVLLTRLYEHSGWDEIRGSREPVVPDQAGGLNVSVIPCHRGGHLCNWPACSPACDGRPGADA